MEEENIKPKINHIEVYIDVRFFFYKMTLRKIKKNIVYILYIFYFHPQIPNLISSRQTHDNL
jgi:hypothetical protein